MAKRKRSVFDYEGAIGPQGNISPEKDMVERPFGEPLEDDDFIPEFEAPEQPQDRPMEEGEWQSILQNGPPPGLDDEPEDESEPEIELPRRKRFRDTPKTETMKKLDAALKKYKENPHLIHNPVLGMVRPEVVQEALDRGAIIKKRLFNIVYYAIPYEEVSVGERNGKVLSEPEKMHIVSPKYLDFKRELEDGTLKINTGKLL